MRIQEKTKQEIEARVGNMSDFLKMEYLENCLKQNCDFDVKKFCNIKLAELYEARSMFSEAAKNMASVADLANTYKDKIKMHSKEAELWIRAYQYERADEAVSKTLTSANTKEKEEIRKAIKEIYRTRALAEEKANKNAHALKIYEKLLEMANENERLEIKKKLVGLYGKLGRVREYLLLKGQLGV